MAKKSNNLAKRAAASSSRVGRDSDQFIARLPDGMRKHLAEVAEREGRSMNAVVVTALALYFAEESVSAQERIEDDLQGVQVALEKLTKEVAGLRKDTGK
jgi:predicted transcriptional regulator